MVDRQGKYQRWDLVVNCADAMPATIRLEFDRRALVGVHCDIVREEIHAAVDAAIDRIREDLSGANGDLEGV